VSTGFDPCTTGSVTNSPSSRMADGVLVLVVITAVGCALMAGSFFAFSAFVMSGLRRLPPEQGMAAMQAINVTAVSAIFMAAFFGTTLLSIVLGVWAAIDWRNTSSVWVLVGSGLYIIGIFIMTAAFHVPRNNRLASLGPSTEEGVAYWDRYLTEWTRGNHLRTLAGLLATTALIFAAITH
jgi:uncharacterized membrane protein